MKYSLFSYFWLLVDFFFPPNCAGSEALGDHWRPTCQRETKVIFFPFWKICGQITSNMDLCSRCILTRPNFSAARSWAVMADPLRSALHSLKYARNYGIAGNLAEQLMALLTKLPWQLDMIMPVPLGKKRQQEMGYHQAVLLAQPAAFATNIPLRQHYLVRTKETRSQVNLSFRERQENLHGAFTIHPEAVLAKNILLIDDVMTSGSTLDACASALRQAGAEEVFGLTIARAAAPAL